MKLHRPLSAFLGLCLIAMVLTTIANAAGPGVTNLRCEFLENPLGIDALQPRLSWHLQSEARGERQTAYQVLVASSPKLLQRERGDLWDSRRVQSDQSIHVRYNGKPLTSHTACYWKVRVWGADENSGKWSEPARWTMGVLRPDDWKAKWIGKDETERANVLAGCSWIWFPEGQPQQSAPVATRYFRRTFELSNRKVRHAELTLAADNEFAAAVNGKHAGSGTSFKAATVMDVTASVRAGENVIATWVKNQGPTPNPAGLAGRLVVEFESGAPLVISTDQQWKTSERDEPQWIELRFADVGWPRAQVLGPIGMAPWGEVAGKEDRRLPARWLHKEFALEKKVERATLYVCGLGVSEVYLNGVKVGDHVLSPGLTEYPKRAFYVTHDVSTQLRQGGNALGVVLGNGRYFAPRASAPTATKSYGYPKLLLQLRLEYGDGSVRDVVSDETWRLTTGGPITANNEYDGEEYDARKELKGFGMVGCDTASWEAAKLVAAPGGVLVAQMIAPIRVVQKIKPAAITEPKPGVFIYDLGQNMVGWCKLAVQGAAGTQVSLRHAETLKPDGTLYLDNIRGARVTDKYTLKGAGTETWEPRFTYHGFRYVEVTGYPGRPPLNAIEGCVVHDDVRSAGEFSCSNPLMNRIYSNVVWGVRGNYRSIPTDCPQRDERQGWLGDRSEEARGETYLFDISALYAKWVDDMADAQKESGSVPDVCPPYWPIYSDNVTWPSSSVIIPGTLYQQYGDTDIIARHYDSAKKWIDYMLKFSTNGLISRDSYGDWCVPPEDPKLIHSNDPARKTDKTLLATSYFQYDLRLMQQYASMLGKSEDARRFAQLAEEFKAAFNKKFLRRELGYYDNGTQTSSVLPLAYDLVPADLRTAVFGQLVKKITEESRGHIGTGLIGGQWLNRVLTANGRPDLVYTMATQTKYPSWGYMIENGATTIWELWNGNTADPAMNSGNHVMLVGDLVTWCSEELAGIKPDPDRPAFKRIIMKPHPVGDLNAVRATHNSPYGRITSEWHRSGGAFTWEVVVPPNTMATVYMPGKNVTEGKQPVGIAPGVSFVQVIGDRTVLEVGAGRYQFASEL